MRNLHIVNSYKTWLPSQMREALIKEMYYLGIYPCIENAGIYLNRSWISIYIEWWLHNILYYLTLPLCKIYVFDQINLRCKDVDLEEW